MLRFNNSKVKRRKSKLRTATKLRMGKIGEETIVKKWKMGKFKHTVTGDRWPTKMTKIQTQRSRNR